MKNHGRSNVPQATERARSQAPAVSPSPADPRTMTPPEVTADSLRRNFADELLRAIRQRWRLIAAITAATAFLAWMVASMQPNRYRASAIAAITPVADDAADQVRGVQALSQSTFVATVAALASTPAVSNEAIAAAGKGYSVRAVVVPSTNLIRVEVEGDDAARAAEIANRVAPVLSAHTRRIFQVYGVTPVSPAAPGAVIFPRAERAAAAGVILGLLLGVTIAWATTRARAGSAAMLPSAAGAPR